MLCVITSLVMKHTFEDKKTAHDCYNWLTSFIKFLRLIFWSFNHQFSIHLVVEFSLVPFKWSAGTQAISLWTISDLAAPFARACFTWKGGDWNEIEQRWKKVPHVVYKYTRKSINGIWRYKSGPKSLTYFAVTYLSMGLQDLEIEINEKITIKLIRCFFIFYLL